MAVSLSLKDCYDRRVGYFNEHFRLASKFPSTAEIHEMRVGLKRLRTFFNLVGSIAPTFGAQEAFAPARKLFRAAGKVRNLHVLEANVREAAKAASLELSEYYNWLKERERRENKKLDRVCQRFDPDFFASAWTSMALFLEGPNARRVGQRAKARLLSLLREIREEKPRRNGVRRLHFLRTRTKEARYTLEIIQESGLAGEGATPLNGHLKDVHQPLGRWHDEEIVLESLREFRKRRAPGPLTSFKSFLEFSRATRARKAENLAQFEAALAALSAFSGGGATARLFNPPPSRRRPAAKTEVALGPSENR